MSYKNRKYILNHITNLVKKNCGKWLYYNNQRGCYNSFERDREAQTTYYLTTIKGNYIRSYTLRYVLSNGNCINTFTGLTIPGLVGQEVEIPKLEKKMILKIKISDYKSFENIYISLTPGLWWYEE